MKKKEYMKPTADVIDFNSCLYVMASSVADVEAAGLDEDLSIDILNPKDSWDQAW